MHALELNCATKIKYMKHVVLKNCNVSLVTIAVPLSPFLFHILTVESADEVVTIVLEFPS